MVNSTHHQNSDLDAQPLKSTYFLKHVPMASVKPISLIPYIVSLLAGTRPHVMSFAAHITNRAPGCREIHLVRHVLRIKRTPPRVNVPPAECGRLYIVVSCPHGQKWQSTVAARRPAGVVRTRLDECRPCVAAERPASCASPGSAPHRRNASAREIL